MSDSCADLATAALTALPVLLFRLPESGRGCKAARLDSEAQSQGRDVAKTARTGADGQEGEARPRPWFPERGGVLRLLRSRFARVHTTPPPPLFPLLLTHAVPQVQERHGG